MQEIDYTRIGMRIRLLLDMGYEVHVACDFTAGNTCDDKQICRLREIPGVGIDAGRTAGVCCHVRGG